MIKKKDSLFMLVLVFCLIFFVKCKVNRNELIPTQFDRTVLVYMEANNNLKFDALNSINGLEQGFNIKHGNLLVYIKTNDKFSYLLKIRHDVNKYEIVSDTIKVFNSSVASDPNIMKEVISFTQENFRASSYGLILWSHATAWAPSQKNDLLKTESFGYDRGIEMDIKQLKNAIPNNFDFIIFDACSMGSIEVLFEFKDKAKYIIASPSETISESYPYKLIVPYLFTDVDGLSQISKIYFDYYNNYQDIRKSATISLYRTSEIDSLAKDLNNLINSVKKDGFEGFKTLKVQRLDFSENFPIPVYDFYGFLNANFKSSDLTIITKRLKKLLIYTASTENFLNKKIENYSGLSIYIPDEKDRVFKYYTSLNWFHASGIDLLHPFLISK